MRNVVPSTRTRGWFGKRRSFPINVPLELPRSVRIGPCASRRSSACLRDTRAWDSGKPLSGPRPMLSTGILRGSIWITCPSNWTMSWPVFANTSTYLYLVLIRADEPVARHLHSSHSRGGPGIGPAGCFTDAYLNVFHKFHMLNALEEAVDFRTVERPCKGPAVATGTAHVRIQVAIERLLCALLHIPDESWIAP